MVNAASYSVLMYITYMRMENEKIPQRLDSISVSDVGGWELEVM